MANESKKFALFLCCLMTMQALRLVISTAGFCIVRFHIDPELFNIFISRLVNAVYMSQLFGNWLGDLIVFAASGQLKLYAIAFANWAEFICFCSALGCFCAGEQGMLNGFYWSIVIAYFWWKVGEAPTISIAVNEADWYFAGFTLSGVWASMLKSVTMMLIVAEKGIHSDVLGDVNVKVVSAVSVVGARSVKTTVDYRAAKALFVVVILVTALMCLIWDAIQVAVNDTGRRGIVNSLKDEWRVADKAGKTASPATAENNKLAALLRDVGSATVNVSPNTLNFGSATVEPRNGVGGSTTQITITVGGVPSVSEGKPAPGTQVDKVKKELQGLQEGWEAKITRVTAEGQSGESLKLTVTTTGDTKEEVFNGLKKAASERTLKDATKRTDNQLLAAIKAATTVNVASADATLTFSSAHVDPDWSVSTGGPGGLTIRVREMTGVAQTGEIQPGQNTTNAQDAVKKRLGELIDGAWKISGVTLSGTVGASGSPWVLTVKVDTVDDSGGMTGDKVVAKGLAVACGLVMGAIFAVPGALMFASLGRWFESEKLKGWCITGSVVGFLGGGFGLGYFAWDGATEGETWVPFFKWGKGEWAAQDKAGNNKAAVRVAALIGLVVGTATGALVGAIIGTAAGRNLIENETKHLLSGTAAGAFIGGFVGLWTGEITNGKMTWRNDQGNVGAVNQDGGAKYQEEVVVICGFFIVVAGLGTVYSIYPGMAPCSITQFKYFNIIDIIILILSSIGPLVIMGVDLADKDWKLGKVILGTFGANDAGGKDWRWGLMVTAIVMAVLMTIATLVCEIIVLDIMQHPFTKTAQKVTTSGWRACTLTILMVSFQLTSTGIGFACVAAGSGFNDGVSNSLSTAVLWTMECCGVLGEGYLTELKKYEPGQWPTQGMGKWATYKWWNRKAFGNAWQILCCIGTTDLRRDIMLCRQ